MSITKRHHYIPVFFIKGYVGDDKMVSVYNKITGKLDNLRKSPKQVFLNGNRNTFKINGEDSDLFEKLYQFGETKFSKTYKKITGNRETFEFNAFEKLHLMYFISQLHWRVPNQDILFLEYIKKIIPEIHCSKFEIKILGKVYRQSRLGS